LKLQYDILHKKITAEYIEKYFDNINKKLGKNALADKFMTGRNTASMTFSEWTAVNTSMKELLLNRRKKMIQDSLSIGALKFGQNDLKRIHLFGETPHVLELVSVERDSNVKMKLSVRKGKNEVHTMLDGFGKLKTPILLAALWDESDQTHEILNEIVSKGNIRKRPITIELELSQQTKVLSLSFRNRVTDKILKVIRSPKTEIHHASIFFEAPPQVMLLQYKAPTNLTLHYFKEGVHRITSTLRFSKDSKLEVAAGARFLMGPGVSIYTQGKAHLIGRKGHEIVFEPLVKGKSWGVFAVAGTRDNISQFKYVRFSGGSEAKLNRVFFSGMLSCYHADCEVEDSFFTGNSGDDAINFKSSSGFIRRSVFLSTGFDAIDLDFSSTEIAENTFIRSGNDSIDLGTAHPHIHDNVIWKAGDKGISIGENSFPLIHDNFVLDNEIGIAVKDLSEPIIVRNFFKGNAMALAAYQKKESFGGGHPIFVKNIIDYDPNVHKFSMTDVQSKIESSSNILGTEVSFNRKLSDVHESWISVLKLDHEENREKLRSLNKISELIQKPLSWDKFEEFVKGYTVK